MESINYETNSGHVESNVHLTADDEVCDFDEECNEPISITDVEYRVTTL